MLKKKRSGLLRGFIIPCCLLAAGAYLVWSLVYSQMQIGTKTQELVAIKAQLSDQLAENEELSRQLDESNEKIIEQVARDELGYAKPNERVFVDMSGK